MLSELNSDSSFAAAEGHANASYLSPSLRASGAPQCYRPKTTRTVYGLRRKGNLGHENDASSSLFQHETRENFEYTRVLAAAITR